MEETAEAVEILAEEDQVQYERVHLFLAVFIPILVVSPKVIPLVCSRVSKLFYKPTEKEKELMKTAVELKKEMSSISMVDEFAKYAKIQRRLNHINLDLEATAGGRQAMQSQINQMIKIVCHVLLGVITAVTVYKYRSIPVFIVPDNWFFPLTTLLAYPTGVPGAISIITWIFLVRNISNIILVSAAAAKPKN